MRLTIRTTGAEMRLSLEADTPADFGAALGVVLDRTAELRLLLLALDGEDDDGDTDGDEDDGGPDGDPGGEAVDRLLAEVGIGTG